MVFSTVLLSLLLLPTVISQIISVVPSMPPRLRDLVTMSCSDSLTTADAHVWSFYSQGVGFLTLTTIPAFALSNMSTNGNLTTSWSRAFELSIAGTYECESQLNGSPVGASTRVLSSQIIYINKNTDVEVYKSEASFNITCRFQSAPPDLSLAVSWCFQPYTFPSVDESSCNAIPNNSEVLPVFPTQNLTSSNVYTSIVRISNVTIANAGFYRCSLSNGFSTASRGVRVRVRDHIETLWPVIGIMIQLVIIVIFILMNYLWDSYKAKEKKIEREKKENQNIISSAPIETTLEDERLSNEHLIKVVPT